MLVIMASGPLHAQEMLGIVNSTYSGISGTTINPANTVASPFYIDINIVAANVFFENNNIYLAKDEYRFKRFFEKNPEFPTHGEDDNLIVYDYYNRKNKKGFANVRLLGPSFAVTVGRHSFGMVTGARAFMSTKNVPYEMAKFVFEQLEFPPQYDINYVDNQDVYNAEMAWAENGINYSYMFIKRGLDSWSAGITVKDLRGFGGAYMYLDNADYVMLDKDTLIVRNVNLEGGYSLPLDYRGNAVDLNPFFKGKGIGVDLGVIYQKKQRVVQDRDVDKLCAQNYVPYKYKIGVSLLDIGRVKFTQNTEMISLENGSTYWPGISSTNYTNLDNLTQLLSNQFYGNNTEIVKGNEMKIALPTAISIQADYNYMDNWYVNGTLVYPVQFSTSGLRRPALLAVSPRYQTVNFEAGMPISLLDWTKPRIGLNARYRGFFIGTEKLSGFFHFTDFTGIDFYFGLKLSLRKGNCRGSTPDDNCGQEEYKEYQKQGRQLRPRNRRLAD